MTILNSRSVHRGSESSNFISSISSKISFEKGVDVKTSEVRKRIYAKCPESLYLYDAEGNKPESERSEERVLIGEDIIDEFFEADVDFSEIVLFDEFDNY